MGRVFAVVALFEAFTWAGLLVGMYLKYHAAEPTTAGVALFGPVHGVAFMVYVVVTVLAAVSCAGRGGPPAWRCWQRCRRW